MLHRLFHQVIQSDSLSRAGTVSGAGTVPLNGMKRVRPVTTARLNGQKNHNRAACNDSLFNGLKKVQPVPDLGLYLTGFSDTQQIGIAV